MEGYTTFHQGPLPQSHARRVEVLERLLNHLQRTYGGQILAAALYGSMARGEDGDFSDIEMFCVLDIPEYDRDYEWVYGAGKAEINVLGLETARRAAREVDEYWAISQGRFVNARWLMGDSAILEDLRKQVCLISPEEIRGVLGRVLVEELYEWLGKARNVRASFQAETSKWNLRCGLPCLAVKYTEMCALMIGMVNRHLYQTGMTMLEESLGLADQPAGYARLCRLVMAGELSNSHQIIQAVEDTWSGMLKWAVEKGVDIRFTDFRA